MKKRFPDLVIHERGEEIPATVESLLARHEDMAETIEAIRNQNVVNFGHAGEPIADALIDLAHQVHAERK